MRFNPTSLSLSLPLLFILVHFFLINKHVSVEMLRIVSFHLNFLLSNEFSAHLPHDRSATPRVKMAASSFRLFYFPFSILINSFSILNYLVPLPSITDPHSSALLEMTCFPFLLLFRIPFFGIRNLADPSFFAPPCDFLPTAIWSHFFIKRSLSMAFYSLQKQFAGFEKIAKASIIIVSWNSTLEIKILV